MRDPYWLGAATGLLVACAGCNDGGAATLSVQNDGGGTDSSDGGGGKDGGQDVGGGTDGGGHDGGSAMCVEWYQYMGQHCTDAALDAAMICAKTAALGAASHCESQYNALYACMDGHRAEWSCGLSVCSSQATAVGDCVKPYCTLHPNDCEKPF